ncbi:MAG: Gamma-glutamyl phosphate reductase [Candidatus Magasanikbacteria bacterium GW2011_GWA2_45_39]|uniref:Gamma-glutamyl phosphate reductase n=2 Tax=Candidatus Magasanikiibacteriota TaxID=1752731 RepID=A0A0G1QWY7_9BACT|nr:MAG: Gamma-glutamyl phosphate reductase [Candidatus Magasanikbacteria bacterium GW2011_GWA2_45_39]KKU13160.1 MAG: Gamma-glutamyl phosphate reductase [Candidatus Magasanikbacteria bacterium GW2011_GWC2_45_8]HBW74223.1 glutamate-5-semialdehyde dehydrogenase [Candidatus Magasanikbacteria bacterium]
MDTLATIIIAQAREAKEASRLVRAFSTDIKNNALNAMADALVSEKAHILSANQKDIAAFAVKRPDASAALKNRLVLTEQKIEAMARGLHEMANAPDPVGEIVSTTLRPNGLQLEKTRIPIGVLCCIYESRPNVTVDIAGLCLKSGNACILRGGAESMESNKALVKVLLRAAHVAGVNTNFVQLITVTDHAAVPLLAGLDQYIDLIIPRGGEALIDAVTAHAKVPVLKHRKGVTHLFVDASANVEKAIAIIHNAKVSNPSACNSLEKALIHKDCAARVVPALIAKLKESGVEVRGCARTQELAPDIILATEADWSAEYLDLVIAIKIVDSFEDAVAHINHYSTGLADGIITEDQNAAQRFTQIVDSAAVYVNTSTRFTDGAEFGLGGEIGINTTHLHGMGPMGIEELTVTKYVVRGDGQIRV